MGAFEDIKKVADEASKIGSDITSNASKYVEIDRGMGSISRGASKAIYYFPILVSKNVAPSTMGVIAQNLEGSYCSFVKACFAMVPAMNVKDSALVNVEDYLQMFHQNIGLQTKDELNLKIRGINESLSEWEMFPNDTLNEANTRNVGDIIDRHVGDKFRGAGKFGVHQTDKMVINKDGTRDIEIEKHIDQTKIKNEVLERNGFRPSVVEIEVTFIIGGRDIKVDIPVGVKTVLHAINSDDLLDHIMSSVAGKGVLHNLIRYTTGELHSLSDVLFGFQNIKQGIARGNEIDKWSDALKHRKRMNKIRNVIPALAKKPYLPNTSVIISMEDVAEIERTIGYNLLTDVNRTIKFMKDNFLLTFVIADDVTETAYVLYDGHNDFDEFPYSTIKRENEKNNDIINSLIKGIGMSAGRM